MTSPTLLLLGGHTGRNGRWVGGIRLTATQNSLNGSHQAETNRVSQFAIVPFMLVLFMIVLSMQADTNRVSQFYSGLATRGDSAGNVDTGDAAPRRGSTTSINVSAV